MRGPRRRRGGVGDRRLVLGRCEDRLQRHMRGGGGLRRVRAGGRGAAGAGLGDVNGLFCRGYGARTCVGGEGPCASVMAGRADVGKITTVG
jgi:hypothetical protein